MDLSQGDAIRLGSNDAKVLFTETQIQDRVAAVGASLSQKLQGECPIFIGILHGAVVFLSDLVRHFSGQHEIDFLKVSRYSPYHADPSEIRVVLDLRQSVRDRCVVVVEGIRAHGAKIEYIDRFLRLHDARRIEYCAMIVPSSANLAVPIHESGFSIDREFVVGYGMDFSEQYRNLSFISAIQLADPPTRIKGSLMKSMEPPETSACCARRGAARDPSSAAARS